MSKDIDRRSFITGAVGSAAAATFLGRWALAGETAPQRPNVILIMTDDQGYADLGCHGNKTIKTPHLDGFSRQCVRFKHFYVSPVCTPTRASLMTGRYNYRTRAIDTYLGRAMMDPEEVALAEMLSAAGYRTGIFGKWHLGDNYPMRAMDQGFQESLVHKGGGIGQPSDPPGNRYFDPILQHNGKAEKHEGYCTDIFTDAAIRFIEASRERPFFVYLATNAPHSPLQIGESYILPYRKAGVNERLARVYGMITNIDDNVGKLLARLDELKLAENTIVIFLTDNGPYGRTYLAGLRSGKGSVYEGGIRVPCFVRWPARLKADTEVDRIAAHIDIVPTLLAACGAAAPNEVRLDGMDLMPLLTGAGGDWPGRTLYFQWHRGDKPELYKNCAARGDRYKLVNGKELYDIPADKGEASDIAAEHPDVVAEMRKGYEKWFADVSASRGYDPPRIYLGTPHENPTTLTRQDWRGAAGWADKHVGYWEVQVDRAGKYDVTLRFSATKRAAEADFKLGGVSRKLMLKKGDDSCTFSDLRLPAGPARLRAHLTFDAKRRGVRYVDVRRMGG